MSLQILPLRKKDYPKLIDFAITGMNFSKYTDSKLALRLYGRYFLYLELERSTHILAAYDEDQLAGVLMAKMANSPHLYSSFFHKIYVKFFDWLMKRFASGGDSYDAINKSMLSSFLKKHSPDGEICFLAVNPALKGQGIGSFLLDEFSKIQKGTLIYLYTDSYCTYKFYDKKGFTQSQKRDIKMDLSGKKVPLTCFLYSKQL